MGFGDSDEKARQKKVAAQANGFGLEWGNQPTAGTYSAASVLTGDASTFEGGIANWSAIWSKNTASCDPPCVWSSAWPVIDSGHR